MKEDNVATVKKAYAAYEKGDIPEFLDQLTSDIKWFAIGPPHIIATAGTRYGRNQVAQYFAVLTALEEVQLFKPEEFIAEEDTVVSIGKLITRLRRTGDLVETPWVHVFNFYHGKISEFRSFYDSAAAVEARLELKPLAAAVAHA
jgi:ketosteroid isomerase-like protein